jgi:hypothetical protein
MTGRSQPHPAEGPHRERNRAQVADQNLRNPRETQGTRVHPLLYAARESKRGEERHMTGQLTCSRSRVTIRTGIACLTLAALGLVGCSGSAQAPSAPSRSASSVPAPVTGESTLADATLSGMVYEVLAASPRQIAGVEGVSVYCEQCGESTHNFAYTNSNGEYAFPHGVWTEGRPEFPIRVRVARDGYQDPAALARPTPPNPAGPGWREVLIHGDTRFDMELVRR